MSETQNADLQKHKYIMQNKNTRTNIRNGCLYFFALAVLLLPSLRSVFCSEKVPGGNIEAQVKAAYIYNFTKFVYWKSSDIKQKSSPINIWVLGNDPITEILLGYTKKQTESRPIVVKIAKEKTGEFSNCQLLFISRSEVQQLPAILKQLEGTGVLTVSDINGFTRKGGMIGFFIEHNRIKIEINLDAVNKAGLQISAKLLEVAKIVSGEE